MSGPPPVAGAMDRFCLGVGGGEGGVMPREFGGGGGGGGSVEREKGVWGDIMPRERGRE